MKGYRGTRGPKGSTEVVCTHSGKPLSKRRWEVRISKYFDWGHQGYIDPGSLQLAYALLRDYIGPKKARLYYLVFQEVIATLPKEGWTLAGDQIDAFLRRVEPYASMFVTLKG
jgi:hypothetical protein